MSSCIALYWEARNLRWQCSFVVVLCTYGGCAAAAQRSLPSPTVHTGTAPDAQYQYALRRASEKCCMFFFLSSRTVQSTSEFCCTVVCTQLHCSNVSLHRFTSSGSLSRLLHSTEEKLLGCHARISSAIRLPDPGRFAWCAILGWYRLELFFNYYYLEKKKFHSLASNSDSTVHALWHSGASEIFFFIHACSVCVSLSRARAVTTVQTWPGPCLHGHGHGHSASIRTQLIR